MLPNQSHQLFSLNIHGKKGIFLYFAIPCTQPCKVKQQLCKNSLVFFQRCGGKTVSKHPFQFKSSSLNKGENQPAHYKVDLAMPCVASCIEISTPQLTKGISKSQNPTFKCNVGFCLMVKGIPFVLQQSGFHSWKPQKENCLLSLFLHS